MKISCCVGDGWKSVVNYVVGISKYEVVFFYLRIVFFFILTREFLKLRTCLFSKALISNRRKHTRVIVT